MKRGVIKLLTSEVELLKLLSVSIPNLSNRLVNLRKQPYSLELNQEEAETILDSLKAPGSDENADSLRAKLTTILS